MIPTISMPDGDYRPRCDHTTNMRLVWEEWCPCWDSIGACPKCVRIVAAPCPEPDAIKVAGQIASWTSIRRIADALTAFADARDAARRKPAP